MDAPPLSLYVHLPWCVRKCPYCDFNSHALRDDAPLPEELYTRALLCDLEDERRRLDASAEQRAVSSVFFGGGTPSLFSADAIGTILERVRAWFGLAAGAEVTLEANPGAIEHGRFDALHGAGVNRISLGAQSFCDAALKRLGRIHGAHETQEAFAQICAAGFTNVNLDLMYALPEQSVADALVDLAAAIALQPSHISHYQLTLEPNTLFHHAPPPLPGDDDVAAMQAACEDALAAAGYRQYEVSAYARNGQTSQHNLNYWQFGDYLGVGAGAHGKLTARSEMRIVRTCKERHPTAYMAGLTDMGAVRSERALTPAELRFEYPLNRLRLKHACLDSADFERLTGVPGAALREPAAAAEARGLLQANGTDRWDKTALGWRFLNDLQAVFLD